jgi:uncharacterized membrane protein
MDTKSIFASRTFWGAVITVIAGLLLPHLGVKLDSDNALAIADQCAIAAGAALAIYGRVKATKRVTLTGNAPAPAPSETVVRADIPQEGKQP